MVEVVPATVGEAISEAISIPTIGIGAGPGCDGQILVLHDVLGFTASPEQKPFTFVKRYGEVGAEVAKAVSAYAKDVRGGTFPADEHSF